MGALTHDLRYGVRMLRQRPGFTAVAVVTLALGIGANTAIFSFVSAILLRPLPFPDPGRLVVVWGSKPKEGWDRLPSSVPNYSDWRDRGRAFASMAAFFSYADTTFDLTGGKEPQRVQAAFCSASLFPILGVEASLGRTFREEEDQPGGERVVIVSHALWTSRFGADPDIVGRSLLLDGEDSTIVGVMPASFHFPRFPADAEVWVPLGQDPNAGRRLSRGTKFLTVIARLAPGVTLAQAQGAMDAVAQRLAEEHAPFNAGLAVRLVPLSRQASGDLRPALLVLWGAVGLVLLIACANVANLLLARASSRRREIAIRVALGSSRLRLVRQLLTESVLLAVLGGALGLLLALWGTDLLSTLPYNEPTFFSPYRVARGEIGVDGRVLGFTVALSLLTGSIFGLAPAWQASRQEPGAGLQDGGSRSTEGPRGRGMRRLLVVSEIALSLVLLIGATLMSRSFLRLRKVDAGFDPGHVLTTHIVLPRSRYPQGADAARFFSRLLEQVTSLPGVLTAGAAEMLPLSGADQSTGFLLEGQPPPAPGRAPQAHHRAISPDYFRAMGIRLVKGRPFRAQDDENAPRVAIVNETMARRFWPGEDPIGKRVALDFEAMKFFPDRPPQFDLVGGLREIVGVIADVRAQALDSDAVPELYAPFGQRPPREMSLVVRTSSNPGDLADAVRREVRVLDPDQPVAKIDTLAGLVLGSVAEPRFHVLLLALFAAVAVALAVVGVYGVISYSVTDRAHEIGVRMALGARPSDVLRLVLKEGSVLALAGALAGLAGALALTRILSRLLFGISPTDPATFAGVTVLLVGAALLASYVPARRAARIDPVVALRRE